MLGAPCSPCCGGCDTESLRAIYDRIRAASCSVSLVGQLPRQDAATSFAGALSAVYARPAEPQVVHIGGWNLWREFICPTSLSSFVLTSSGFQNSSGTRPAGGTIVFSGNSDPSPSVNRSRLEVSITIDMIGSLAGGGSLPTYLGRRYSVIPGTTSCYILAEAEIRVRTSMYSSGSDESGVVAQELAAATNIGSITLADPLVTHKDYSVYGCRVAAPYYRFDGAQERRIELGAGGPYDTTQSSPIALSGLPGVAYWNYAKTMQQGSPPTAIPPKDDNNITGTAQMKIYSDDGVVTESGSSLTIGLNSPDSAFGGTSGFPRWQPNSSQSSDWGETFDQPTLLNPGSGWPPYNVRFSYQSASQKYAPAPPAMPFVTSLGVTLS